MTKTTAERAHDAQLHRDARAKLRHEVFAHYGMECAACREADFVVLTIDHVLNDGAAHRKSLPQRSKMYQWLKDHGFPAEFQTLCFNCNYAKHQNGGAVPARRIKPGSKMWSDPTWTE